MSVQEFNNDLFNPALIAQIATRLYNEVPKDTFASDNPLENTNELIDDLKNDKTENFSYKEKEDFNYLENTDFYFPVKTLESHPTNINKISLSDYYFLTQNDSKESDSLKSHAQNLTMQHGQLGNQDDNKGGGLKRFIEKIQNSNKKLDSGLCVNEENHPLKNIFNSKRDMNNFKREPFDIASIKKDFPIFNQKIHGRPLVWLDNAATTQKPKSVINSISSFYENDNSNIHRGAHTLAARSTDAYEQSREKARKFLNAGSDKEIVFVRGTTEGINLVAHTYGKKFFQPGDEIILSTLEHHANIVPWQIIAKEKGAIIRVIPIDDNADIMLDAYQSLLNPRTKFVSLAHANNSIGTILPIKEMILMAKRYDAKVLIDGAQSVAHIPVNVQDLDCDFFVFSGHKIFGPTGIGVLYGKKELLEIMPPWQGGGNMIRTVTFEETTYSDIPAKFEAGTPNIADAIGLGSALDYVNRIGLDNIAKHEKDLLEYATQRLSSINGLKLVGKPKEKVGVLSFIIKDKPSEQVGKLLDLDGIAVRAGHHCAQPSLRRFGLNATVRPSLSLYNTFEDVDRLFYSLKKITG